MSQNEDEEVVTTRSGRVVKSANFIPKILRVFNFGNHKLELFLELVVLKTGNMGLEL